MNWNEKDYSHVITNLWSNIVTWFNELRQQKQKSTYNSVFKKQVESDSIKSKAEYNVIDKLQKDYDAGKIPVKEVVTYAEYGALVNAEIQRLAKEQAEKLGKDTVVWGGFKYPEAPKNRILKE